MRNLWAVLYIELKPRMQIRMQKPQQCVNVNFTQSTQLSGSCHVSFSQHHNTHADTDIYLNQQADGFRLCALAISHEQHHGRFKLNITSDKSFNLFSETWLNSLSGKRQTVSLAQVMFIQLAYPSFIQQQSTESVQTSSHLLLHTWQTLAFTSHNKEKSCGMFFFVITEHVWPELPVQHKLPLISSYISIGDIILITGHYKKITH